MDSTGDKNTIRQWRAIYEGPKFILRETPTSFINLIGVFILIFQIISTLYILNIGASVKNEVSDIKTGILHTVEKLFDDSAILALVDRFEKNSITDRRESE